jgi:uncharacterized protein YndB with AHSA1/START domain
MTGYVATAIIDIGVLPSKVWQVLVDPERREYMFGSEMVTDWRPGSPILFRGEWEGQPSRVTSIIRSGLAEAANRARMSTSTVCTNPG